VSLRSWWRTTTPFGPVLPVFDRVYHLVPQQEVEPYSQRHTWRLL
jgi:hypothetical protein